VLAGASGQPETRRAAPRAPGVDHYERFPTPAHDDANPWRHLLVFPAARHFRIGYHTTEPTVSYTAPALPPLTETERAYLDLADKWYAEEGGYDLIQATRPQTLAYGLNDSPAESIRAFFRQFR
jgi:hypothetical protein